MLRVLELGIAMALTFLFQLLRLTFSRPYSFLLRTPPPLPNLPNTTSSSHPMQTSTSRPHPPLAGHATLPSFRRSMRQPRHFESCINATFAIMLLL